MFLVVDDDKIWRIRGDSVIGRSDQCDFVLDGPGVADRHCRLHNSRDTWWITSLDGAQTRLKRGVLEPDRPTKLGLSDEIGIGHHTILVRHVDRGGSIVKELLKKLYM